MDQRPRQPRGQQPVRLAGPKCSSHADQFLGRRKPPPGCSVKTWGKITFLRIRKPVSSPIWSLRTITMMIQVETGVSSFRHTPEPDVVIVIPWLEPPAVGRA